MLIPSYNGARKLANLTPLLALLLAREGVPVLVHGVQQRSGPRHHGRDLRRDGHRRRPAPSPTCWTRSRSDKPCFMPIELLAPKLAHMLSLRRILGVRNSTHTLVKILQPFDGPALRLVSYTHPEYLAMLGEYFTGAAPAERGDAFLMRGTEGETVANANRAQQIDWFHGGATDAAGRARRPDRRTGAGAGRPRRRRHRRLDRARAAPARSRCRRRSPRRSRHACSAAAGAEGLDMQGNVTSGAFVSFRME